MVGGQNVYGVAPIAKMTRFFDSLDTCKAKLDKQLDNLFDPDLLPDIECDRQGQNRHPRTKIPPTRNDYIFTQNESTILENLARVFLVARLARDIGERRRDETREHWRDKHIVYADKRVFTVRNF
jgi:hypothetical protein